MVLVDTSVWILTFRRNSPLDLEGFVAFDEIVTCLPVIQEILQGFREERAFRAARQALLALPILESPLEDVVFLEAATLYRSARRAGITIRSSADCLIAACALRADVEVLHSDRDFAHLARISPLRQREVPKG